MKDYILFMHSDAERRGTGVEWSAYFEKLRASGRFQGGSAIGSGECLKKSGSALPVSSSLVGYIRITASSLEEAKSFVVGNPTFEAGGTKAVNDALRKLLADSGGR